MAALRAFHAHGWHHGAAFANAIWCRAGTSLVEFHRLHWRAEPNSPLYVLLSRALQLRHWVIVDTESEHRRQGYAIPESTLVATARAALLAGPGLEAKASGAEVLLRDR